ncbi:Beta-galactosidase [Turnera subulata]|uniref:Beta-galactosidase n=1 Tax=Turnera subulata TaxID=218843 RepID=A0A9Q0G2V4_9ROSI|nr:Beta-galactosidase [Turnera subulata]
MATTLKLGALAAAAALHSPFKTVNPLFDYSTSVHYKLVESRVYPSYSTTRHTRNPPIVPAIKAQYSSSPNYVPDSNFYKVEAIVRPWRVSQISLALLKIGIRGVTISDVRGFGAQGGSTERHGGSEFSGGKFVAKVKMEIVVSKDQVEDVIKHIIEEARTGEIGDGKIFLIPVADVIRIRTGERGEIAERMTGGRSEMVNAA